MSAAAASQDEGVYIPNNDTNSSREVDGDSFEWVCGDA
jgi:hypothetical protein